MKIRAIVCLFAATVVAAIAQNKTEPDPLAVALKLREEMATGLIKGNEQSEAVLARLRGHASPTGLKIDKDADFAFSAIDVGRRLIAAGKHADAEKFFLAAEQSLEVVLKKTPDTEARDKVQYLSKLAFIRAHYLNKPIEAKNNLDSAKTLQPEDKHLDKLYDALGSERGNVFKDRSQDVKSQEAKK